MRWSRNGACARDHERFPPKDARQYLDSTALSNETNGFPLRPMNLKVLEALLIFLIARFKRSGVIFLLITYLSHMGEIGRSSSAAIKTLV